MQTTINGIVITLTPEQIKQVDDAIKKGQPVTERIKSWDDAAKDMGESNDSLPFKNPKNLKEQQTNAFFRLATAADALNYGKTGRKYWIPYFLRNGAAFSFRISYYVLWDSDTNTDAAARLAVFDKATSDYFAQQFLSEWEIFTKQPNY